MISSTTPHKLAEIYRDTWPNLYRPIKKDKENMDNYEDKYSLRAIKR
jgi:hypothetical protein